MKQLFSLLFFLVISFKGITQTTAYSTSVPNNQYISPVNIDLVNKVLSEKQSKYDKNIEKIDDKINNISKLVAKVSKRQNNKLTERQSKYITSVNDYIKAVYQYDFSNSSVTYEVLKTLDKVEETIFDWL